MVGNLCFVASILSMKNDKVIGGKDQKGRGVREMRRNRMVF